jgi:hypothetical protein
MQCWHWIFENIKKKKKKKKQHVMWANHDPRVVPQILSKEKATKSMSIILLQTLGEES